jgi:hypothetical protein
MTKLQIPVKDIIKDLALERAEEDGFSSLQEVMRVFLTGYAKGKYNLAINNSEEAWVISEKQAKRYKAMSSNIKEKIKKGDIKTYNNTKDFMADL